MLENILSKHIKINTEVNNENKFKTKTNLKKKDDHDNELDVQTDYLMSKKTEEILKKYSTLNNIKEENKYQINPLTKKYLEKKKKRINDKKTTGEEWFNMTAPEMTPELKEDLKAVQLRHIIDPAHFYKKMDRNNIPKFFQIGTIMDNIIDGKNSRLKKSEVKQRIAEEFLSEDKSNSFSLRKFEELQNQRRKIGLKKNKLNKFKQKNMGKKRGTSFVEK